MADKEQLALLRKGIAVWDEWRSASLVLRPDLTSADLANLDLRGVNFYGTNLRNANLQNTQLTEAFLEKADLRGADLTAVDARGAQLCSAQLRSTRLWDTDLRKANLSNTNLVAADFRGTRVAGARFTGARMGRTVIGDVDLSEAEGLDLVDFLAPCTIGIDSLLRSNVSVPDAFLRGAGIPGSVASSLRVSILRNAFYSCFISYSIKDSAFADRIHADLQSRGVRCWYFPEDAVWGEPIWGEIMRGISVYDKLIVICSEHSLRSTPVLREIERALQREDSEGKNILFPVRVDDYVFEKWVHPRKPDLIAKVLGDFRGWRTDSGIYQRSVERLTVALSSPSMAKHEHAQQESVLGTMCSTV